jgi:hypothetical protein
VSDDIPIEGMDFRELHRSHVERAKRQLEARDYARLTGTPPVDVANLDARTLSRDEYLNLVDRFRGGVRAGRRTEELSRQLREARRQRELAAFQSAIQNSYRKD